MRTRGVLEFLVPACALALSNCGGAQKPPAETPPSPAEVAAPAPVPPTKVETQSEAATSGQVQISDEIRRACGISDADAYFPFDSSHLTAQDLKPLNLVATCFATGPLKGRTLKLIGRADPRGETEYNMVLGQSRADAVSKYLTGKGVEQGHVSPTSRGAMDASGTDDATWAKDRRVELLLAQ